MSVVVPEALKEQIDHFYQSDSDIRLVSLCTPDGFKIYQASVEKFDEESDKIAAIASTLSSLSNSIAEEIIGGAFKITFIEADEGNFVCIYTRHLAKDVVLTVYASSGMSLGELRVKIRYLLTSISVLAT